MVTTTESDKVDSFPALADLRNFALEKIAEHAAAVSVIVEALADADLAYRLAVDCRTQDDWQVLRDAERRLALLVAGEVSQ